MMKNVFVFLSLMFPLFAQAAQVDQRVAFELFQRDVHPFLRKNCSECHGEGALGWSGPPHSYADPKIAYGAFIKRINFDNPEQSLMFRQAKNQHFCKEFYSCNEVERRSTEAMAKVMQYIANVKTSSAVGGGGTQSSEISNLETQSSHRVYEKNIPWQSQEFKLEDLTISGGSARQGFIVTTAALPVVNELNLNVSYKRVREGMYVLTSLKVFGVKGIYAFQDMKILINGKPLSNLSGLENLDRAIYFTNQYNRTLGYRLTLSKPVIMAKPGDKVSIAFGNMQELDRYPSLVCDRKKDEFFEFRDKLSLSTDNSELAYFGTRDLPLCYRIESLLDFRTPRRSPLLEGLEGQYASRTIDLITKWME